MLNSFVLSPTAFLNSVYIHLPSDLSIDNDLFSGVYLRIYVQAKNTFSFTRKNASTTTSMVSSRSSLASRLPLMLAAVALALALLWRSQSLSQSLDYSMGVVPGSMNNIIGQPEATKDPWASHSRRAGSRRRPVPGLTGSWKAAVAAVATAALAVAAYWWRKKAVAALDACGLSFLVELLGMAGAQALPPMEEQEDDLSNLPPLVDAVLSESTPENGSETTNFCESHDNIEGNNLKKDAEHEKVRGVTSFNKEGQTLRRRRRDSEGIGMDKVRPEDTWTTTDAKATATRRFVPCDASEITLPDDWLVFDEKFGLVPARSAANTQAHDSVQQFVVRHHHQEVPVGH